MTMLSHNLFNYNMTSFHKPLQPFACSLWSRLSTRVSLGLCVIGPNPTMERLLTSLSFMKVRLEGLSLVRSLMSTSTSLMAKNLTSFHKPLQPFACSLWSRLSTRVSLGLCVIGPNPTMERLLTSFLFMKVRLEGLSLVRSLMISRVHFFVVFQFLLIFVVPVYILHCSDSG